MKEMKVGFIGLGAMGKPMAVNVFGAGFETAVYDIRKEPVEELQKLGAKVCGSPKEVAAMSDAVISMVRDDKQTEEAIYGKDGVLDGLEKGVIITMSTISPGLVQKLALKTKDGVEVLDAPVSGGVMGAEAGTLTIMAGGKSEVLDQYRSVLEAMGKRIIYCGGAGAGLVAKLTNSMIVEVTVAGILESLSLAGKEGIDPSVLFSIYRTSTAGSWLIEHWDWWILPRRSR
jgi:3-hydroxyisobutyrate dehydrogenase-like beta-hydroxyacid dehydrogenase